MRYGVNLATEIFQRLIENGLSNTPYIAAKFDDVLMTGKTDTDHLENLET